MAAYDTLRAAIDNYIKANGNKEITGTVLNDILNAMVSALGADTRFAGVAVPSTNPGNPEGNVVYFASQEGTYSNFGGIVLPLGIHILVWNGTAWTSQTWFSVDNTPTQNSQNLATSGGILQAIVDAVGVERLRAIGAEVTSCSFDGTTKKISFFNSANNTLFQLDATAFVIDGMVSDVKIEDGNLVIQFNTDAGKQDIEIPLTDIFNPANYYTKTAIDELLALYYTKTETDALLTAINNKLADGCLYRGMAEPTTNPPTPTTKVFYIATKAGTYTNFGNIAVTEGITILKYDGSNWSKEQISYSDGVFDISAYNGTSYADLSAALGTNGANIPQNLRKGGMSVKFVQSSDNKYVQYRYFGTAVTGSPNPFLDVTNWVGKTIGVSDSPAVNEFIKELYILPYAGFTYQDVKSIDLGFDGQSRITYYINGSSGSLIYGTIPNSTSHNGVYLLNNKVYIVFNNLDIKLHKTLTLNVQCSILDMNPAIENYINGNEIAGLKTRTDNIDSYINNKGVSNNRDINAVIDEFYIGSDAGFTYQDVKIIDLGFDGQSRITYYIDGNNGNLIRGTIDDSTNHNGVYQLGIKDVYIAFNNLTAIRRTGLTLNSCCGVLSCNPRVSAYKNKKYIDINTSDIEGIENFISDEKISNKDTFNEVVAELYIDASVAGFSYSVPNSIQVTTGTNIVQVWFYNGSTRLAAGTINNPQIYTVYKVVNGIYIVLKKIAASGIATALTQRCGSIVANDKIYSYFNKQSITAIENDIARVYTANNNVLWLGTSISEGGGFPQTACAANHYNCIKKAVSASGLTWDGVKPSYPLSWHSCLHLTITQAELETMFREDVTNGLLSEEILNLWKNNVSYEGCLMPYINGTNPTQVSMIVIEHGYNDRGICHSQMQDAENINWDSENRATFTGAFRYLINRIQEVNPFVKIVIAGHFTNTVIGTYNPSTQSVNHMDTKDICDLQSLISKHYNIPILKIWEHSQIGNYYVSGSANYISEFNTQYSKDYPKLQLVDNNYDPVNSNLTSSLQMYCPDGVHPNSDLSGNSEQRLDGIYTKLLKNII